MPGHGRVVRLVLLGLLAIGASVAPAEAGLRARSGEMASRPAARLIAAGEAHTCVVQADGTVRCWGKGHEGQLGHGQFRSSLTPVTVSDLTRVVGLAGGAQSTCAFTANGDTWCWGSKQGGSLGDGTFNWSSRPVKVIGLTQAMALEADWAHACAVRADGRPFCWGLNFAATLGDGTTEERRTAVAVSDLTDVVTIATGGQHSCALGANGTVACWGRNDQGQLGVGGATTLRVTPVTVPGLTDAVDLVAAEGGFHTCALRADGTAVCWGSNGGALGDGTTTARLTPVPVVGLSNAIALAAGEGHTCALRADGTVLCWGSNQSGELGDGTTERRLTPVPVPGVTNAIAITAGWNHTCAVRADGSVVCWGANVHGQLGDGTTVVSHTPREVVGIGGSISARGVWGGELHSCAIRADSRVTCWGANEHGQLGNDSTTPSLTPTKSVVGSAVALALGGGHTCALGANGNVSCWGRNDRGQVGTGSVSTRPMPPTAVRGVTNAIALTAGASHTCALRANGTVLCWGDNRSGQLGDGSAIDRAISTPVTDPGDPSGVLTGIVGLAAGDAHTCAVRVDGTAFCWGDNRSGQLGTGTTARQTTPAAVALIADVVAMSAGEAHTCARRANGAVSCWGSNIEGGLGDGTTTDALTPVSVVALNRIFNTTIPTPIGRAVGVVAGRRHACALIGDGTARCWGHNGGGELGDGTSENRLTAVPVARMVDAAGLTAGANYTCHLQADGQPFCWGHNEAGQIGDGTTVFQFLPVAVPSFLFNIDEVGELRARGRVVDVHVLMHCPEPGHAHVYVTLTQDRATGRGVGAGRCMDGLASYKVTVPARGREPFEPGPADASLDAVVRERGRVVDEQTWQEVIELVP